LAVLEDSMLAVSVEYNVLSNANAPRTLEFSIQAANLMLIIEHRRSVHNRKLQMHLGGTTLL